MNFYDRYKYLCGLKRLSPQSKEVLDAIGVTSGTVTGWSRGATPKPEIISNIARYFDISADYLLGLSDIPHFENTVEEMTELLLNFADVQVYDDYSGSRPEYIVTYDGKSFNYQEHEYNSLCTKLKSKINDSEFHTAFDFCQEIFGGNSPKDTVSLSAEEKQLIEWYRTLPDQGKTMVSAAIITELRRLESNNV